MPLLTLLGITQLAIQDAISANLVYVAGGASLVPNFLVVSLRRESFQAEYQGPINEERERFRREVEPQVAEYVAAHGWRIGGNGTISVNVLIRSISNPCNVQMRVVESLYALRIRDDNGERVVLVKTNPAILGRAHGNTPRGFIPVADAARILSREHLRCTYTDLQLAVRLLGSNPTTLNGVALGDADVVVHAGDVIACGECRVEFVEIQ